MANAFHVSWPLTRRIQVRGQSSRSIPLRRDILARQHHLSDRQALALGWVLDEGRLTIQELEALCPGVNRRTLQRDLRVMVEKGLLAVQGQTNRLEYVAAIGTT